MSEPRFELLDSYVREVDREADLIVPPLSASHVRRVGRSRRTRRVVIAVVVVMMVLLSLGATLVLSNAMTGSTPPWATPPSPTQASPAPTQASTTAASATPTAQASTSLTPTSASTGKSSSTATRTSSSSATAAPVVTLAAPLELKTAAQVNAVAWMSSAAKTFLVSELARVRAASGCSDYLIVSAYSGTDLISGSTSGCDNAQVTWGKVAGTWKVIFAGQAVPTCTEVRTAGWPSTLPADFPGGQCYDPSGNVVSYTP